MKNRLKYVNDWEKDRYFVNRGKDEVSLLRVVDINGTLYQVKSQLISVPYYDHGHQYTGDSLHYFVEHEVFGIKMQFDLNQIVNKTLVLAVAYDLQKDKQLP